MSYNFVVQSFPECSEYHEESEYLIWWVGSEPGDPRELPRPSAVVFGFLGIECAAPSHLAFTDELQFCIPVFSRMFRIL